MFVIALGAFAACNSGETKAPAADSVKVDSVKVDSVKVDSVKVDSAKVDSTKK